MNGILRTIQPTVPKATFYRVAAGVALGATMLALGIAFLVRPSPGAVIEYVVWPFLTALAAWVVAVLLRLRSVGHLPTQPKDDDFIPRALQPWIRVWLLARLGLVWAMITVFVAFAATLAAGRGANYALEALIYVVVVRMFMDAGFGAAFNFGIIIRRRSDG